MTHRSVEKNSNQSFEDLLIWQESIDVCLQVYHILENCNDHGLKDQMQRSAVSVSSNIAEGFERQTNREFIHYLYIAKGSSGELRTQLYIAIKLDAIETRNGEILLAQTRKVSAMIQNFIKARKQMDPQKKKR